MLAPIHLNVALPEWRLIDETTYMIAKLRTLDREIDGVLTQEMLITECDMAEG